MKTLQIYLSAFFDLIAPPEREEFINDEPPVRSWRSMVIPIVITLALMVIIVLS